AISRADADRDAASRAQRRTIASFARAADRTARSRHDHADLPQQGTTAPIHVGRGPGGRSAPLSRRPADPGPPGRRLGPLLALGTAQSARSGAAFTFGIRVDRGCPAMAAVRALVLVGC